MKRTLTLTALAVASTLVLAACAEDTTSPAPETPATTTATDTTTSSATTQAESSGSSGSTTAEAAGEITAEHNAADIMFSRMMIPHHQQAIDMSEMLLAKDNIPTEVAEFAQGVIDAQGPEIDQMNAMLETWGQQPAPGGMGEMGNMNGMGEMGNMGDNSPMGEMSGMGNMSGMMSEQEMAALDNSQGAEAVRLYLEHMITHHEGAIDMADNAVNNGRNPQSIALAEKMITDQEAEIAQMKQMLATL